VAGLAWNLVFSLIPVSLLANCAPSWTTTLGSGLSSAAICCQPSSMMRNRGGALPLARLQEQGRRIRRRRTERGGILQLQGMYSIPLEAVLDAVGGDVGVECVPGAPAEPVEERRQLLPVPVVERL
jgi:hypothetical protein